jgi:DNA-binding NarL/FixJ family response regulator
MGTCRGGRGPEWAPLNSFLELGVELRVFLVEDLQRMRALLGELFASIGGFRVIATATTEAEANLWLEEHPGGWDVAIIDLVLEQGAGMNVIRRAKSDPNGGQIVVFSSYATPGVRQHCLDLGADAVFDKGETARFIAWFGDLTSRENSGP